MDHSEQILPLQPCQDALLVGRDRRWIAVVDEQGANRRRERRISQGLIELDHIDRADRRILPLRHIQGSRVEQSSSVLAPGSHDGGQAANRAEGHRAMTVTLHPDQETDHVWRGTGIGPGLSNDLCGVQSCQLCWVVGEAVTELVEAERILCHVVGIVQSLGDDDVHHADRECRITARQEPTVPVGCRSCACLEWVNDHHRGPVFLRLMQKRPEMQIGDEGIGLSQEDEPAVDHLLWEHAGSRTDRRDDPTPPSRAADRSLEPCRTKSGKEGLAQG